MTYLVPTSIWFCDVYQWLWVMMVRCYHQVQELCASKTSWRGAVAGMLLLLLMGFPEATTGPVWAGDRSGRQNSQAGGKGRWLPDSYSACIFLWSLCVQDLYDMHMWLLQDSCLDYSLFKYSGLYFTMDTQACHHFGSEKQQKGDILWGTMRQHMESGRSTSNKALEKLQLTNVLAGVK